MGKILKKNDLYLKASFLGGNYGSQRTFVYFANLLKIDAYTRTADKTMKLQATRNRNIAFKEKYNAIIVIGVLLSEKE